MRSRAGLVMCARILRADFGVVEHGYVHTQTSCAPVVGVHYMYVRTRWPDYMRTHISFRDSRADLFTDKQIFYR